MVTLHKDCPFSLSYVQVYLWALPHRVFPYRFPNDSSHILSHKSHNTYLIDLEIFVLEREQNYLQDETKLSTIGNIVIE